ncbi:RagB/SusD family nutrient uptake outer membrane protein [Niabella beijingensis]|uniref:RagB/SusD family nutrient uptake outer membrane protein n=1 Tax=Niabella beijingensis TaxID=2872700 RepID=UPI001CBB0B9F|nr:RagB/SusD family nutrient uptake outer membrane protein [Niabella beijingensis]MBZ4188871.1 RagB/SusD family nutrient uptake outer membrane protein [Niabella beijingensis]
MKIRFVVVLCLIGLLGACKKSFLDKQPDESITIEEAFKKRNYAEAFLTDAYASMGNELYFTDYLGTSPNPYVIASDELNIPWPEKFEKLMNKGAWNPYNVAGQHWKNMFEGIRKCNIFLKNIPITPLDAVFTQAQKNRWIGEARFLRAFYYFTLIRIYGGVPLVKEPVALTDDFTRFKRNTWDECVDFIVKECDTAVTVLPIKLTDDRDIGRATAAAALALKARLLLYTASPLWNGNPDYRNVVDKDGVRLFTQQQDDNRWAVAAEAAKECIDKCEAAGYELFRKYPDPIKNYQQLFLENHNTEVLFARNCGVDGVTEKCAFPGSKGGWNGYNPTQQMVDAYEMQDGKAPITGYNTDGSPKIDPASGYVEAGFAVADDPEGRWLKGVRMMYTNREPRFYASINFNGGYFIDRRLEIWYSGADGQYRGGRDYNTTGYLLKKAVDPTVNISQGKFSLKTWIFFRLAELYLDYAEALNEAQGPVNDVYVFVNKIRDRAGLPALPGGLSKEAMREKIRHERRIELSFETHRYFDCHRWKIAAQTEGGPVYGMNITTGTALNDESFYKRVVVETRVFQAPKHYLFPIPQSEIDKNPNLLQSPYW